MDNLFQNGSKWLRADFHLHTRADKEFQYSGTDNDYVNDYVNKLVEQNIQVGVITNHNKFNIEEYKAISKKARKENIFILPGVELLVNDGANGVHTLIIFDPKDWIIDRNDYINQFITANFMGKHNFENENGRSNFSLKETLEQLKKMNRNNFVINETGKGSKHCFVKIGAFNFEAVRYALIDFQSRVSEKTPVINNSYIKSINFEGGLLNGKEISFSPELNSLIGIRGSGKSSMLEILRYALNIPQGAQAMDKDYKNNLIEYVLKSGGKVSVKIVNRQGETYKIERIYGQRESIYKNNELQQGITLEAILHQPVYFGQKDLSNKDSDFESDLVNKLIGGKLNDIKSKIELQKQEVLRIVNDIKSLDNISDLKKETETAKSNAEHKLQLFKEKGVAEKLQIQTSFDADISKLENYYTNVASYAKDLNLIIQNNGYLLFEQLLSDVNKELFEEASKQAVMLKLEFDKLKSIFIASQEISINLKNILSKMQQKKEEQKEEFAKIKREINIPELNPDEFIKLSRIAEISKLKLIEIEKTEVKRMDLNNQLMNALVKMDNLWYEKFKVLQAEIKKINDIGTKLTIDIEYKARKDKFANKLQESFKGSNIRTASFEDIAKEYADFIDIFRDNFQKIVNSNLLSETQLSEFKKRFMNDFYNLAIFEVENKITIKFENKPLNKHSLGQRASALILFLLAQKENDILIIDQPEDDLDNQTIYTDVIHEIKKLKGDMQFIFATHNANIPVLGDSEMVIACQYADGQEIQIETGSIDCHQIQEKIIQIMEGGKEAFDYRKNIYKIWERNVL